MASIKKVVQQKLDEIRLERETKLNLGNIDGVNVQREIKPKNKYFGCECSSDIIDKLNVLRKEKYRGTSRSHAFRMIVEDAFNDYAKLVGEIEEKDDTNVGFNV